MSIRTTSTTTTPTMSKPVAIPTIVHQICMEIMLEAETLRINMGKIVFNLFNKVHALAHNIVFSEAHIHEMTKTKFLQWQEFIERMMMTQAPSGKKRKFIAGFFLRTTLILADINVESGTTGSKNKTFSFALKQ
jgi:hypothetical protein